MKRAESLRPPDLAVALSLVLHPGAGYEGLGTGLGIGAGGAHRAVRRLQRASLVAREQREVLRENLKEFLVHGVRFVFFAEVGAETLGVPTAHKLQSIETGRSYVWPSAQGSHRGEGLIPLLPQAIHLPESDPEVYEALAVVDSIRIGGIRERRAAAKWFEQWFERSSGSGP